MGLFQLEAMVKNPTPASRIALVLLENAKTCVLFHKHFNMTKLLSHYSFKCSHLICNRKHAVCYTTPRGKAYFLAGKLS